MMATVRATTPEWVAIRDFALSEGRFFTYEENERAARVGVIGSDVRETLFGGADPLGRTVFVGIVPIEVIGVLESKGLTVDGLSQEDNLVVVPTRTGPRRIFNVDHLASIYVEVANGESMDRAASEIESVLRDRHDLARLGREDDFASGTKRSCCARRRKTAASFRRMLNTLGATALALGGVGILSVMLLAVKERTAEIGLRLAVGAKRRDVLVQFLAESTIVGLSGGIAGLLLGRTVAWALAQTTQWTTAVAGTTVALALGSALLVGVVFGMVPAARAARLDPIDALRGS
ncbi:MAG: ABC transporter permease [Longimicrobiales bacterium]